MVLTLLFVGYLFSGFQGEWWATTLYAALWLVVLLATLWAPGLPERLRVVGLTATFLATGFTVVVNLVGTDVARAWGFLTLAVAQAAALLAVLSRISRHQEVGFQTVMGGISAYALIAFVMSSVYTAGDLLTTGAFLDGVQSSGDFTYFSFITLTTVGFGDITPASELAKRLVVIEAFVGQVFLITLVARLVSLWGLPIEFRRNR
jgi:hypothetical protein